MLQVLAYIIGQMGAKSLRDLRRRCRAPQSEGPAGFETDGDTLVSGLVVSCLGFALG